MPESELVPWLRQQIIRYISNVKHEFKVKIQRKRPNDLSKQRRGQNLTSVTCLFRAKTQKKIFLNMSPTSNLESRIVFTDLKAPNTKCTWKLDPSEVYECIQDWFEVLYQGLSNVGGSRIKSKLKVVHLSNIKQFFLSLGVVSRKVFCQATKSFKGFWVDHGDLVEAIENLNFCVKKRPMKNASWLIRKHMIELVFFFRLFQTVDENPLNYGEVEKIVKIALRACPDLLASSTLHALFKVSKSSLISFQEFFRFIVSYL